MTDANYTHITVLIDRSGSMKRLQMDTIEGFNSFLKDQRVGNKATMTLGTFATSVEVPYSMLDLTKVPDLNKESYAPDGGTALLDATGFLVNKTGKDLAALPEEERPGKVLFLIVTDGEENSSHEFSKEKIAEMVKHQEEMFKWTFIYLGANVDAFAESGDIGIRGANALNYAATSKGVRGALGLMSSTVGAVRTSGLAGASYSVFKGANHVDDIDASVGPQIVVESTGISDSSKP